MNSASQVSSAKSSTSNLLQNKSKRKISTDTPPQRQCLGALSVDKKYLEKLLKDPHIKCLNKENKDVINKAEEALTYLNNREKFWIQQFPPIINNSNYNYNSRGSTKRNSTSISNPK